jgi:uncharacterized repeat protein (TIGR01451 family)
VPSNTSSTTTPVVPAAPKLVLDKRAAAPVDVNGDGKTDAGDTIAYTFVVANAGNVTIDNVAVTDAKVGAVTCSPTTLAPGAAVTCTAAPYVLTQADVDAGSVDNTATGSGTDPSGARVPSNPDSTSTPATQVGALSLVKKAGTPVDVNNDGLTDAGDTIAYTFTVTNTGTVTIDNLAVSDPKVGTVTCSPTTLVPGASVTCVADSLYVVTAADEAAGAVRNTATAAGIDPRGNSVPSNASSTTTPVVAAAPKLMLDKQAATPVDVDGDGFVDAGDTIAYTFVVTNAGNVTIANVVVTDAKVGPVSCSPTTLAPGDSVTCTAAPYTITQADVDAGSVDNTATAAGDPPCARLGCAPVVSPPDSTSTMTSSHPGISIVKSAVLADANHDGKAQPGEKVGYHFVVTNTGTVTLTDVAVDDPMLSKAGDSIVCPSTTLAPRAQMTCTATHVVAAGNIVSGAVVNTATASGRTPRGGSTASGPSQARIPAALPIPPTAGGTHGPPPIIPDTGGPRAWLGILGAGLMGAGIVLIMRSRRRSRVK